MEGGVGAVATALSISAKSSLIAFPYDVVSIVIYQRLRQCPASVMESRRDGSTRHSSHIRDLGFREVGDVAPEHAFLVQPSAE